MGFGRGGRGGGDRSSSRGGSFRGGRSFGNKSNSSSTSYQESTPDNVVPLGFFVHSCEGEMVCKSTHQMIPYFNAPIYLENKTQIGKIDEILGPINEVYFTVKTVEGVVASSFREKDQVYVSGEKLLPLERFMPKPKAAGKVGGGGKKKGAGGPRTAASAFGRGAFAGRARGGGRGGGASRGGISKFNRGAASRGGSSFRGSGSGGPRR